MPVLKRRDFLISGGMALTGLLYLPACTSRIMEESDYRFFTKEEARCVIAFCEQLIPADEQFGGATDAGVIIYIDRQLAGYLSDHAPAYRENLSKLQNHCKVKFGNVFQDLSSSEQIKVMEKMEANEIGDRTWKNTAGFFRLILSHTMQGFYGSPIHGGNREYLSYNMLELEYPLNIGQNRYRQALHNTSNS